VTPARTTLSDSLRVPFWSFQPLRPIARRVLLVVVAIVLIGDSLLRATSEVETGLLQAIVSTALTIVIALFAWRPPLAAAAVSVGAVVAAVAGVAGDYLLGGALILGIVAVTCSPALIAAYTAVMIGWGTVEVVRPSGELDLAGAVVIGILGMVSLVIGITIRQQYDRWTRLSARIAESEREVAEQLRRERDLIADELHDIVAHEITIVALHAAVLDRTEDEPTRRQSQSAIREAAVQALTDIRRVLGMVRGEGDFEPERVPSPDGLEATVDAVVAELEATGIDVDVRLPPSQVRIPNAALLALIRVIRESSTNVLKHATGASRVRIAVTVERGWVHLDFSDDSPPAHTAGLPSSGYGLMRLRERFRLFGGSFDAERRDDGWIVRASLPLTE